MMWPCLPLPVSAFPTPTHCLGLTTHGRNDGENPLHKSRDLLPNSNSQHCIF
jgi:hypothetical protein